VGFEWLDPGMLEREQPVSDPASGLDGRLMQFPLRQTEIGTRAAFACFDPADHCITSLSFVDSGHR